MDLPEELCGSEEVLLGDLIDLGLCDFELDERFPELTILTPEPSPNVEHIASGPARRSGTANGRTSDSALPVSANEPIGNVIEKFFALHPKSTGGLLCSHLPCDISILLTAFQTALEDDLAYWGIDESSPLTKNQTLNCTSTQYRNWLHALKTSLSFDLPDDLRPLMTAVVKGGTNTGVRQRINIPLMNIIVKPTLLQRASEKYGPRITNMTEATPLPDMMDSLSMIYRAFPCVQLCDSAQKALRVRIALFDENLIKVTANGGNTAAVVAGLKRYTEDIAIPTLNKAINRVEQLLNRHVSRIAAEMQTKSEIDFEKMIAAVKEQHSNSRDCHQLTLDKALELCIEPQPQLSTPMEMAMQVEVEIDNTAAAIMCSLMDDTSEVQRLKTELAERDKLLAQRDEQLARRDEQLARANQRFQSMSDNYYQYVAGQERAEMEAMSEADRAFERDELMHIDEPKELRKRARAAMDVAQKAYVLLTLARESLRLKAFCPNPACGLPVSEQERMFHEQNERHVQDMARVTKQRDVAMRESREKRKTLFHGILPKRKRL